MLRHLACPSFDTQVGQVYATPDNDNYHAQYQVCLTAITHNYLQKNKVVTARQAATLCLDGCTIGCKPRSAQRLCRISELVEIETLVQPYITKSGFG
jgi:hypothetical protein